MDAAAMLTLLAQLPEDQRRGILQGAARSTAGDVPTPVGASGLSQEAMAARFRQMRVRFVREGGILADAVAQGLVTPDMHVRRLWDKDAKPTSDLRSLRKLKPLVGAELELGATHRGRNICGWVAVDHAFFGVSSSSLILQDVTGLLVEINAYKLVNPELPKNELQRRVAAMYPLGKPIVVCEPYYKVRLDGSHGIRVENPHEMFEWRDAPTDIETWKKLGNDYFSATNARNEGRGALSCYQRALDTMKPQIRELAMLLGNLATCRFKMEDFEVAIQLAGTATLLDPTYVKGWNRLVVSLVQKEDESE